MFTYSVVDDSFSTVVAGSSRELPLHVNLDGQNVKFKIETMTASVVKLRQDFDGLQRTVSRVKRGKH